MTHFCEKILVYQKSVCLFFFNLRDFLAREGFWKTWELKFKKLRLYEVSTILSIDSFWAIIPSQEVFLWLPWKLALNELNSRHLKKRAFILTLRELLIRRSFSSFDLISKCRVVNFDYFIIIKWKLNHNWLSDLRTKLLFHWVISPG